MVQIIFVNDKFGKAICSMFDSNFIISKADQKNKDTNGHNIKCN